MRSSLLSSSQFGRFYQANKEVLIKTITLQKVHELAQCKITLQGQRVYLLDSLGKLSCLNLSDKSISTLPNCKLQNFHPDSRSSLSLTAISPSSQILHIQYQNKKVQKVCNPCLNSLVGFQKNYLTQTILLLEQKILVLIDGAMKIKSLKSKGNNLFVSACFLGINRYLSVLLRSGDVQIYQISSLKMINSIRLPFPTIGMKIASSNNGKTIAIYGNTCWLFLINFQQQTGLSCKLSELPFNSVLDLQFSYKGDIVLLGSDRILYGIHFDYQTKLKPLFNQDQQHIPSAFDISTNEKNIVLIAGKSVHILEIAGGLHKTIIKALDGIVICLAEQTASEHILRVNRDNQISNQINQQRQLFLRAYQPSQNVPIFDEQDIIVEGLQTYSSLLNCLKNESLSSIDNKKIIKAFIYLSQSPCQQIAHSFKQETIKFIYKLYQITRQIRISALIAYELLSKLSTITNDSSLQKLAIILAPKLVKNFQNSIGLSLNQFITRSVLDIFQEYVPQNNSRELIKILVLNLHKYGFIQTFLINLALKFLQNDNSNQNKLTVNPKSIELQVLNLLRQPKYAYIYAKPAYKAAPVVEKEQGEDLQQLLQRQQKIKHALQTIRTRID